MHKTSKYPMVSHRNIGIHGIHRSKSIHCRGGEQEDRGGHLRAAALADSGHCLHTWTRQFVPVQSTFFEAAACLVDGVNQGLVGGGARREVCGTGARCPNHGKLSRGARSYKPTTAMAMGGVAAAAARIMVHFILLGWFGVGVAGTNTLFAMCT